MADLTEKQDSRVVVETNDKIRITLLFFGAKANFVAGANGWAVTIPTSQTPAKGLSIASCAAASGMTWSGYDTPLCVYIDKNPRWTAAKGFLRMVFEGDATWVA